MIDCVVHMQRTRHQIPQAQFPIIEKRLMSHTSKYIRIETVKPVSLTSNIRREFLPFLIIDIHFYYAQYVPLLLGLIGLS